MATCHLCTVFFVVFLTHFCVLQDLGNNDNKKFNVVLFLAKTQCGETYTQDSGIKFLNFVEQKRVKHSIGTTDEDPVSSYSSPGSDCKQLLKTGIYSLISYARTNMGMTTAIASVENDTFSNGLRFRKSTSEDLEIRYHHPRTMRNRIGNILANHNQMKNKPQYITQPEHSEVFKIRSKRQYQMNEPVGANGNNEVPSEDNSDSKWDIFGVMANIKLTFFGKLFDQNNPSDRPIVPEPLRKNLAEQIGKVCDNTLFYLVKETLVGVQDGSENGFLMIVLGGNLKEINDAYSGLMQSVKHVVENTDCSNTLIVVTGSCPLIDNPNQEDQPLIPVYVKSPPKMSGIAVSNQLYDVPYAIKNLLADMNGGSYFGVQSKRTKRDVSQSEEKNNRGSRLHPLAFLISIASTSVLIF